MAQPLVSVVIVNWKSKKYLGKLLTSLKKQPYRPLEVLVVNNSKDEKLQLKPFRARQLDVRVITPSENLGFAAGNNKAIEQAKGEYIFLLNPDTAVRLNTLQLLVQSLEKQPEYDAALPKILSMRNPDKIDRVWDGYSRWGLGLTIGFREENQGQYEEEQEVFGFQGAAALIRRSFFEDVGFFDEQLFAYYEDVDLNLRARLQGKRFLFQPRAVVFHLGQGSSGSRYNPTTIYWSARNKLLVYAKNMPSWLMVKHGWRFVITLMATTVYHALWSRNGRAILRGYWHGLKSLPQAIRSRGSVQKSRTVSLGDFQEWLIVTERQARISKLRKKGKYVPPKEKVLEGEVVVPEVMPEVELVSDVDQDDAWLFEDVENFKAEENLRPPSLLRATLFSTIMGAALGSGAFVLAHLPFWRNLVIGKLDQLNCDLYDSCKTGVTWEQGIPFIFAREIAFEVPTASGGSFLEYEWEFDGMLMLYDWFIFMFVALVLVGFLRWLVPRVVGESD